MAAEKDRGDGGLASSCLTLSPPADSPKRVTRLGSPPNAAMFCCTHCRANRWSRKPEFWEPNGTSGELEKPKTKLCQWRSAIRHMQTVQIHTVGPVVDSDNYDILGDSKGTAIVVLKTASAELEIALLLSMPLRPYRGLFCLHRITKTRLPSCCRASHLVECRH